MDTRSDLDTMAGHNMPRPTILHLITSLDVGGAEMMLARFLRAADHDRFDYRVVCLTHMGPVAEEIASLGVRVASLDMEKGMLSTRAMGRLSRYLRDAHPAVLQTWLYHADLLGLFWGRRHRVPSIFWNLRCTFIDLEQYRCTTGWVLKTCALLSRLPQGIVSNSEAAVRFHRRLGYRPRTWHVIPNGIDLRKFKPDLSAREKLWRQLVLPVEPSFKIERNAGGDPAARPPIIGCVARFDPMKDHGTFVAAALQLLKERPSVHFVLAGRNVDWNNPFFRSRIPERLRSHFHLLGQRTDIERLVPGFDIASLASYGEGFPNAVCEAMACAVPCVVTDVGDCAEMIGQTGWVVAPRDPLALAAGWKRMLALEERERRYMGDLARRRITERYDIGVIARRYEELYASAIEKDGSRSRAESPA